MLIAFGFLIPTQWRQICHLGKNCRPFWADRRTWPISQPKITNEMWGVLSQAWERDSWFQCGRKQNRPGAANDGPFPLPSTKLIKWTPIPHADIFRSESKQNKGSPGELLFVYNKTLNCYSTRSECQLLIYAVKQAWTKKKPLNAQDGDKR